MAGQVILADSIADIPHLQAFDLVWEQHLSQLEIDAVLVYLIDNVSSDALPYLANQFDVEGEKGYRLAKTDEERRSVIKRAIELKRYIGTAWAVKEAIKSVGYADAELIEGVDEGTPEVDWAKFRVITDLGNDKGFDEQTPVELSKLINFYKPARSHLLDISFRTSLTDTIPQLTDSFSVTISPADGLDDLVWISRFMDGQYKMDGSQNMNEGNDNLIVNIQ